MRRTTIYLTEEQKQRLEALSRTVRRSEAELIREGVDHVIEANRVHRKPGPLFALEDSVLDDPARTDEALEGFGSD